jgi:hypothetical protein
MNTSKFLRFSLIAALVTGFSTFAHAQATRTWVSGVGDDANPCSRTAPCKTFAGAISKTAPCGEISVLDPGGFGAVTITKSITINGTGTLAGILSALANAAVIVNAGANDTIILRDISMNGACSGINGIRFLAGRALSVEHCWIYNMTTNGIDVPTSTNVILNVLDSYITNMGTGINFAPTAGSVVSEIDHTTIQKLTGNGITTNANSSIATVTHSNIINAAGFGVNAGGAGAVLNVDSSSISSNGTACRTAGGFIRVTRNVIMDNTTNFTIAGGTIASAGNNQVAVNGATVPNGSVTQQ